MPRAALVIRGPSTLGYGKQPRTASHRDTLAVLDRLRSLLGAGLPPGDALRLGAAAGGREAAYLARAAAAVERGTRMSQSLLRAGIRLAGPDIALLVAGERSATLATTLDLLCRRFADRAEARQRLVRALAYPIALLGVTVAVVIAMTTLVLPSFVTLYANASAEVPATTRVLLSFGGTVKSHGLTAIAAAAVVVAGLKAVHAHSRRARASMDAATIALPLAGTLVTARARAEFYATVACLLRAGVDLEAALQSAAATVPNAKLRTRARAVVRALRRGTAFSAAVAQSGFDPSRRDTAMLRVGEAIGDYPGTCERIARLELEDYGRSLDTIARVVEPVVLLVMAAAVSAAALAIYQPVLGSASLLMGGSA